MMKRKEEIIPIKNIETCPECLPFFGSSFFRSWAPQIDIYDEGDYLVFKMDLPEVNANKDVEIKIEGRMITIKGKRFRTKEEEGEGIKHHRTERFYGEFSRSFSLPEWTDITNIKADYDDGILKVIVPKKEEMKPRSYKVEIG